MTIPLLSTVTTKPILTYFDFDGGRAETTRITMSIAGVDFEDHRISFPEFGQMRKATPLNAVPTLKIDDVVYTQSNAMNRYYGKMAKLYPSDPWKAFKCDEIMEALEDAMHLMVRTFGLEGDELKTAREKLTAGPLTTYLKFLDTRLKAAGGQYMVDGRLTVADIKVFIWLRGLKSGTLDHVPTDLIDTVAPDLIGFFNRIGSEPGVTAYYEKRKKK